MNRNTGRALIVATALLWGLAGVCIKSISWGALSIACARNLISLIMMLIVKKSIRFDLKPQNIAGALCMSACGALYVTAIKLTTAGTAIVLQYIAPILVFLYAVLFQGRSINRKEALLVLLTFAGIVLSFLGQLDFRHMLGNLLALASGLAFAAQIILLNAANSNSEDISALSNLLSFLLFLPFFLRDPAVTFTGRNIFWILVLGVFQYGLANICFAKGIRVVDKVEASLLLTIEPIFNPIPVAFINGEMMTPLSILGAAVVIAAVTAHTVLLQKTQA